VDESQWVALLTSTLRLSTPLVLCALAGLFSERSGIVDIGLEGKMLFAAFAAGAVGAWYGSTALALLAAIAVAVTMSCLHGFACVRYPGDQVVSGLALNIIAAGLTVVLGAAWFGHGGQTPALGADVRMAPWWRLGANPSGVPAWLEALLSLDLLVLASLVLVPLSWWLLYRTRFGLRLRAVGENPHMVEAAGVSVPGMRFSALTLNGVLCGLAGAYLVLAQSAQFSQNMTAGRGFMALAALIFGRWQPGLTLWACLLFGFLDAASMRLQGLRIGSWGEVPVQLIQALPYLLTVILLAGFVGKAVAPAALGKPYRKER
jgi:general nucleoside transport system permease protein